MSDPPPRKVGSLRDRIAAFENKGSSPAPTPPPPRPKPGHVTWQPKPASPTSARLPVTSDNDDGGERKPGAGMSAADAQQSIGKLSLKERMAALQGTAAFGGPAGGAGGPPPARPAGEKPKWKPPPVVQKVEPIGGEDEEDAAKPAVSPPATAAQDENMEPARSPQDELEAKKEDEGGEGEPKEEGEPDPEDEERKRRAALAARMARLGGARVGMGPPIFGKKPDIPPKRLSKSEEKPNKDDMPKKEEKPAEVPPHTRTVPEDPTVDEAAAVALPPSVENKAEGSTDYFPERKDSSSDPSSLLSPELPTVPPPVRSPHMPVPQAPRRAAPPRKRPAKSPSPAPPVLGDGIQESPSPLVSKDETASVEQPEEHGDRQPEVTEGQIEDIVKEVVPQAYDSAKAAEVEEPVVASEPESVSEEHEEEHIAEPSVAVVVEVPAAEEHAPESVAEEPQPEVPSPVEPEPLTEDIHEAQPQTQHEEEHTPVPAPEQPAEEPEEDEAARRKRIAERLAKSGGFNPFAGGMPPPVRRESSDSARSPPPPPRRDSLQEATSPKPSLPERKASVGSVESGTARKSSLDVGGFAPEEPHIPESSAPAAHELYEEPIEEGYEDEEAEPEPRAAGHGGYDDHEEYVVDELKSEKYEDTYGHGVAHAHKIAEQPENVEVTEPAPLPAPPRATRSPPAIPQAQSREVEEELKSPPPLPRRDSLPPPPRRVSVPPPPPPPPVEEVEEHQPEYDDEDDAYARHAREVGSEHEAEEEHEQEFDERGEEEYEYHVEEEEPIPHPPPPARHAPVPPPPPPPVEAYEEDEEEESTPPPLPPPPRIPSRSSSLNVPPPLAPRPPPILQEHELHEPEEVDEFEEPEDDEPTPPPPPPRSARPVSQVPRPPPVSATGKPVLSPLQRGPSLDQEMFDDTDGDPIDPRFYSPKSPSSSQHVTSPQSMTSPLASPPLPPARMVSPPPVSPPPPPPPPPPQRIVSPPPAPERAVSPPAAPSSPPPHPPITAPRPAVAPPTSQPQEERAEDEEDEEQARRRTIAERMAKLGGIHFGAPLPIPSARRAPPPEPEAAHERDEAEEKPAEAEEAVHEEEEEDEFARKQRIAARIAGMGGMRFGMMPGAAPPKPPPRVQHSEEEEEGVKSPSPPKRSAPVPPAAEEDHGSESDYQHVSDSDRFEHEESELEEVTHEDAQEEAPPPVPDRHARRVSSGPPPVPHAFGSAPPVPRTRPPAPPAFTYPPPPHAPHPAPTTTETQGDFIVVDQPQSDEPPPPPPPRAARPPGRAPPRAPPTAPEGESQWEAPTIPSIDFGGETDLSLSGQWSEDSTNYPPAPPPASHTETAHPPPPAPSHPPPAERNFTADELQAQWGRVGVQVHEIAATLFDKSKKSLVGDGSYRGFVAAVVGQVPNAVQPTPGALDSFGYLVYSQAGAAVQRRVSDIMPGDVIVVSEAKFKGHKGLQSYSQTVGVGEPLVGVIGDFELKKSKVKVYQANQHVGQQSVESVSYRLEDLKSGAVKIYRVLEA